MKKTWLVSGALVAVVAVVACTSNSSSGPGGSGDSAASCYAQLSGSGDSTTCSSCIESKCASQLTAAESACSSFISCICPGGTYSATAATSQTCIADEQAGTCSTQGQTMGDCAQSNCESECSASTSSSSSSSGSSSGSSSSATTYYCTTSTGCFVLGNGDSYTCTIMGGTLGASCPTANLVGCCLYTSPNDYECFYSGTESSDCPGGGWMTTIP